MKRLLLFISLALYISYSLNAQIDFQEITENNIPPVNQGSTTMADVDSDGDIDLFITGNNVGTYIAKLFLNDGNGIFTESTTSTFMGVSTSSAAFADIDGDTDQDLLYFGSNQSFALTTKLYINNGSGVFSEATSTPFPGLNRGSITFGDIDNDNDNDLLLTGEIGATGLSVLYSNDGLGNFTEVSGTPFLNVSASAAQFSDIDQDTDLDVLITGFGGGDETAKLYLNDSNGNFSENTNANFEGVLYSTVNFADMDGDLDDDVIISGRINNSFQRTTKLYSNNGNGEFSLVSSAIFDGVETGTIGISDVDGDGQKDVLVTGLNNSSEAIAKLYMNQGLGTFAENTETPFDAIYDSRFQVFADIDQDNDDDVLIFGSNNSAQTFAKVYRNVPLDVQNHPDYNALVALYNATNGPNWFNNTNWLDPTKPINTWYGVLTLDGTGSSRVSAINLNSNNLNGIIPDEIGDLTNLFNFYLSYNNLTGALPLTISNLTLMSGFNVINNNLAGELPDISNITDLSFINIQNNKYIFADLESQYVNYNNKMGASFIYAPQQNIGETQGITLDMNESVTLNIEPNLGSQLSVDWYFIDAQEDFNYLDSGLSYDVTINSTADYGDYVYFVDSGDVTGLSLESNRITIGPPSNQHPDYATLETLYNSLQGDFWTTNTNWLDPTKPINTWYGITETNGRVARIDLNTNNLQGVIPASISSLTSLDYLDLRSNFLVGQIPSEIGTLQNITWIDFRFNYLEGSIPTSITTIPGLYVFVVSSNNLSGNIPDFTTLSSSTLDFLYFDNNQFVFADFEDEFTTYTTDLSTGLIYSPQQRVGEIQGIALDTNETITLNIEPNLGSQLIADWYFIDDQENYTYLDTGLSHDVTVNSAADYGDYIYFVDSAIVTGFSLESNRITIGPPPNQHPDYNALIAIYNALDGPNWTNPWNILAPINTWEQSFALSFDSVTGRVNSLSLINRNLSGTIPAAIGDLTELVDLEFFQNDIIGEVPSEIWNLTKLKTLFLGAQESRQLMLSGGIPSEISNLQDLEWLNLTWIPLTQPLQPELFNLPNLLRLRIVECGLTGILPAELALISDVLADGNEFEGAIPQEFINSSGNNRLSITSNYFDFSDLEPLVMANNYNNLSYSPQRTRDTAQNVQSVPGQDIVLNVDDTDISRTSATAAAGNEYQWFKNGNAITGANSTSYTITNAQETDSGTYYCEITNTLVPDLVIRRADITVLIDSALSLNENGLNSVLLYPNPVKETFNIKLNNFQNASATLYDIRGRLILNQKLDSELTTVNISNLNDGIYVLNVENKTGKVTKRIIKK